MSDPFVLDPVHARWSLQLAEDIVNACEDAPPMCGIAALISVTGTVCFNEAEGDKDKALKRASDIAAGIRSVILKLHQNKVGNGNEED